MCSDTRPMHSATEDCVRQRSFCPEPMCFVTAEVCVHVCVNVRYVFFLWWLTFIFQPAPHHHHIIIILSLLLLHLYIIAYYHIRIYDIIILLSCIYGLYGLLVPMEHPYKFSTIHVVMRISIII